MPYIYSLTHRILPEDILIAYSNGWEGQLWLIVNFHQDRLRILEVPAEALTKQVQE